MMDGVQHNLGKLEGRADAHDKDIHELRKDLTEVKGDVKEVLEIMNQAKGSWKTLVMVGGISGAIGATFTKLLPFIWSLPK